MTDYDEISEFEAYAVTLKEQGISTVEQFLSIAMSDSRENLRQLLNLAEEEMDALVKTARSQIDPEYLEKLETTEVKEFPLGCLEEREDDKDEKDQVRDA